MKIGIVGCGAMGSVYAGRLGAAGHDLVVVDPWADHVAAMNERGLSVRGPGGSIEVPLRAFVEAPEEPCALVVVAVKAMQIASAVEPVRRLVGPETVVLTIQNGLGGAGALAEALEGTPVLAGVASGFGASMVGPAVAHHNAMRAVRIGSYAADGAPVAERIAQVWAEAGFDAQAVGDVLALQWRKLICNVAYSAPCALSGLTVGAVLEHPELGPVSRSAAVEAWEVAARLAIDVDVEDPEAFVRDFAAQMPAAKPSALLDHEAGRVSEIAVINGAVPGEAARVGLQAPVNATLAALALARESAFFSF